MKKWINKYPPNPFFGPENYYPGMDVKLEVDKMDKEIEQWYKDYENLSFVDRVRLMFSSGGIWYEHK